MTSLRPDPNDPHWSVLRDVALPDAKAQPDRSMVIVLGSVVDEVLRDLSKSVLVEGPALTERFLYGMGPLATFSPRIDLGFLLGLYPARPREVLHGLCDVRISFAHNVTPLTLASPEIVKKMRPLERHHSTFTRGKVKAPRLYIAMVEFALGALTAIAISSE